MKKAKILPPVNPSGGNVTITSEQYREYKELQAKRDRTLISLQTQKHLQFEEELRFAREVKKALESIFEIEGFELLAAQSARNAYDLANEILARE